MDCCTDCFLDSELRWRVAKLSTRVGRCPSCASVNVSIVAANALEQDFALVADAYEKNPAGLPLADVMQADWSLFRADESTARRLVDEILPASLALRFSAKEAQFDAPESSWLFLREQLTNINRFFPENPPDKALMQELTGLLVVDQRSIATPLYRARVRRHEKEFLLADMGAPPRELVAGGRANPPGIPYLYLASTMQTAVAEVRPSVADVVCVGTFEPTGDFKLVDLSSPRERISPFKLDADSLHRVRSCMNFLCVLGRDLSSPTPPYRAATDYLVTQYLCELIKDLGYDGVMYSSAVSDGLNVAAFDPSLFEAVGTVEQHVIRGIEFAISVADN